MPSPDCDALRERWIEAAYDELDPAEETRLAAHLAACDACRAEVASLRDIRRRLHAAFATEPSERAAPVVMLHRRSPRRVGLGLLAAAALAGMAVLAVSRAEIRWDGGGAAVSFRLFGVAPEQPQAPERTAVLAALQSWEKRNEAERQELADRLSRELDERRAADREERQAALEQALDRVDRRRAEDLRFVLGQIGSLEQRTGQEVARTQQMLQYAVLTNPAATAR